VHPARELWTLVEPLHAVTYFAPEGRAAYEAAGLRGFWRGYFAGRAAAFGAVGPEPVVAAFFGFAPVMVSRALPSVWDLATPEESLRARRSGAVASLDRVLRDAPVDEAVEILERAVEAADLAGRVLAAVHAALPRPDEPVARLWHAATILREHRGDGHVAALVAHDLDGCESLVLRSSIDVPREVLQPNRGWTDEEWEAATERLAARGVLGNRTLLDSVEAATDAAAIRPWRGLDLDRVRSVLAPLALACRDVIPPQTPLALPPA
jgi:hypothetical protein